jgi:hypothetical protein
MQINDGALIRFTKLTVKISTPRPHTMEFEVAFDRLAELILKGFGDDHMIIFSPQLQAMSITTAGEVEASLGKIGVRSRQPIA